MPSWWLIKDERKKDEIRVAEQKKVQGLTNWEIEKTIKRRINELMGKLFVDADDDELRQNLCSISF